MTAKRIMGEGIRRVAKMATNKAREDRRDYGCDLIGQVSMELILDIMTGANSHKDGYGGSCCLAWRV